MRKKRFVLRPLKRRSSPVWIFEIGVLLIGLATSSGSSLAGVNWDSPWMSSTSHLQEGDLARIYDASKVDSQARQILDDLKAYAEVDRFEDLIRMIDVNCPLVKAEHGKAFNHSGTVIVPMPVHAQLENPRSSEERLRQILKEENAEFDRKYGPEAKLLGFRRPKPVRHRDAGDFIYVQFRYAEKICIRASLSLREALYTFVHEAVHVTRFPGPPKGIDFLNRFKKEADFTRAWALAPNGEVSAHLVEKQLRIRLEGISSLVPSLQRAFESTGEIKDLKKLTTWVMSQKHYQDQYRDTYRTYLKFFESALLARRNFVSKLAENHQRNYHEYAVPTQNQKLADLLSDYYWRNLKIIEVMDRYLDRYAERIKKEGIK